MLKAEKKASASNLLDLPAAEISRWLQSFDTVLSDCDGTIWHDDTAIEGAPAVWNALQRAGKRAYLITNNGTKTRQELWQRSQRLGFQLPSESHLISPTTAIVDYLRQSATFDSQRHKVYVIGSVAIAAELKAAGIASFGAGSIDQLPADVKWPEYVQREFATPSAAADVGAVVVGWDEHFSYCKLARACHILCANPQSDFLVTNKDAVHKYPAFNIPGTGAFVAGIEAVAQREALEMGKPNPLVLEPLLTAGALTPNRTLMIGDCCNVDVAFARNCGFQSLLVGTGNFQLDRVNADVSLLKPDVYLPKLGDLLPYI